jgi:hypothetical protein
MAEEGLKEGVGGPSTPPRAFKDSACFMLHAIAAQRFGPQNPVIVLSFSETEGLILDGKQPRDTRIGWLSTRLGEASTCKTPFSVLAPYDAGGGVSAVAILRVATYTTPDGVDVKKPTVTVLWPCAFPSQDDKANSVQGDAITRILPVCRAVLRECIEGGGILNKINEEKGRGFQASFWNSDPLGIATSARWPWQFYSTQR